MSNRLLPAVCLTIGAVGAVIAINAQSVTKPSTEVQRLNVFVGKWTVAGQAQASPYGPAGKIASTDTFQWLAGGFFMEHRWDSQQGGKEIKGMEVIGWDSTTRTYTSRFFDNLGNSGAWKATVSGNTWTWTADTDVGGKPLKERGTWTISGDTILAKFEYSSDGVTWKPNAETTMTRSK